MILQNQNIMFYGSDEEKSLSLIGITSGLLQFAASSTTSHFIDLSNIKFKKMLLCSKDGSDINAEGYFQFTYNSNGIEFSQSVYIETGPVSLLANTIRQYAEYLPSNIRGITFTGNNETGSELYYDYNIAFFA